MAQRKIKTISTVFILCCCSLLFFLLLTTFYSTWITDHTYRFSLSKCPETPPSLGTVRVLSHYDPVEYFDYNATVTNHTDFSWPLLVGLHSDNMAAGGRYQPQQCRARHSTAIVVPYRDREQHLRIWLNHILPFLKRQQLEFQIFVIEQSDDRQKFNRAALLNIGFIESRRIFSSSACVIFHDVDLLPENDRNLYVCDPHGNPKHMSVAINKHNYKLFYKQAMGGVTAITIDTFRMLNGFSNKYWGWGGEDDDMWLRVTALADKIRVVRPSSEIGRYKMLRHSHNKTDEERRRFSLWKKTKSIMHSDGLSSVKYKTKRVENHALFTKIVVTIEKP